MPSDRFWGGGERVEVERVVSGAAVYFPATVINAPSVRKNMVWVEYQFLVVRDSLLMKEFVSPSHLRPSPPCELKRWFKAGDDVDVFSDSEGCWVRGNVTTILEDSRYIVKFEGGNLPETEVRHFNLRLHREWEDGLWVPSLLQSSNVLESTAKRMKLKIKCRRKDPYEKGNLVEVRSEEEAYKGSWYCARILSLLGDDKYIVEHLKFRRDDGDSIPLRDVIEAENMRPVPPEVSPVVVYEPGDEVDAWFNKRWWIGRIEKVLGNGSKYLVYFVSTREASMVLDFNLRPRKDWINGQWVNPPKEKCYKSPLKKLKSCDRTEKVLFDNGMIVEVRSDEKGYERSWFSAKIKSYLGGNKYIVEYQTLKADDGREWLKEEARGWDIRPIPPKLIPKEYRYEVNEEVDAWYNDGWWSGRVYRVNKDYTRYEVYFETTGEILEFEYSELRLCQMWVNGKWSSGKD